MSLEPRLLLGSGPSPVPERVLRALAQPTIGHLDPQFGAIMDEVAELLRATFRTENRVAFPLSATGSGGMQAMVDNLIEPGDRVVCGVHGLFGERMADALGRAGGDVVRVEAEWGRAIPQERLIEAWKPGSRALFVVHGETSTGVAMDLTGLADAVHADDGLLLIDCVTSLAGHPLGIDEAGADAAFSGSQKCLNCPPGLAPFTLAERATGRISRRSWYFDLEAILGYWRDPDAGGARAYHHTAPINMVYALREALAIVHEEGLPARWARHATAHEALRGALAVLGFERLAPDGEQLHSLLCVRVPDDADDAALRGKLLNEHGIEVSGGLGPLAGKAWRIGVMGEGARLEPQQRLVEAVATLMGRDASEPLAELERAWA
ncbi:MAG: Serine--pyruvate aminotransferase [Solirubrobacteraceae bacterium]|nr:Serine--pyruvate aminotransferase [Solirubrobacteraceae bacterium]